MRVLFLITVDCDLRCDDVDLRQESLEVLLDVFGEAELAGHITWFLNENDFYLTRNHEPFLMEVVRRGDGLGVHDHFERFRCVYQRETIRRFCLRSKETVERWLRENGHPMEVRLHRNGCLVQHPTIYAALKDLGYRVVSEVYPGKKGVDREDRPAYDNRSVPLGVMPYRHDEGNFMDWGSREGHFVQVPVMHMFLKNLDFKWMERWIGAFEQRHMEAGILLWLFHPYEVLGEDRRRISPEAVDVLRSHVERCRSEFGVKFANLEEALSLTGYL